MNFENLQKHCLLIIRDYKHLEIKDLDNYDIDISFGTYYDEIIDFKKMKNQ